MNVHIILFLILLASIVNLFYRGTKSAKRSPTRKDNLNYSVDCNPATSVLTYGHLCQNKPYRRGDRCLACKSERARDNALNELIDVRTGLPVADDEEFDLFETCSNGEPAYRCRCGSLDDRGNRMIDILPYECFPDYCVSELENVPSLGWNGRFCECGPFPHADPEDPTSPCVRNATSGYKSNDGMFHGRVECVGRNSYKLLPLLCPEGESSLSFEKKVWSSKNPLDFVRKHKESQPSIHYRQKIK